MKALTLAFTALVAIATTTHVMAEPGMTRSQVKAELAEAIQNGDMIGNGESGLRMKELFPQRYPAAQEGRSKTREQVKLELSEAIRSGDMPASGESGQKFNELYPGQYPSVAAAPGVSRDHVKAELAEAIRTGEIIIGGELAMKANEMYPTQYPAATRITKDGTFIVADPKRLTGGIDTGTEPGPQ